MNIIHIKVLKNFSFSKKKINTDSGYPGLVIPNTDFYFEKNKFYLLVQHGHCEFDLFNEKKELLKIFPRITYFDFTEFLIDKKIDITSSVFTHYVKDPRNIRDEIIPAGTRCVLEEPIQQIGGWGHPGNSWVKIRYEYGYREELYVFMMSDLDKFFVKIER